MIGNVYWNHTIDSFRNLVTSNRKCNYAFYCRELRFEHGNWICRYHNYFCTILHFVNYIVQKKIYLKCSPPTMHSKGEKL